MYTQVNHKINVCGVKRGGIGGCGNSGNILEGIGNPGLNFSGIQRLPLKKPFFLQMNMTFYPFDIQRCNLTIEDYSNPIEYMRLHWNHKPWKTVALELNSKVCLVMNRNNQNEMMLPKNCHCFHIQRTIFIRIINVKCLWWKAMKPQELYYGTLVILKSYVVLPKI